MTQELDRQEFSWVGKLLGKFKIIQLLGCGGMGAVYKATHVVLEKTVCVKILFPSLVHPGKNTVERFLREAKAIAKLEHPNIVQIYDIEKEQDIYFIVMEYIEGKTLTQLLEERETLTAKETVHISIEVARALDAAHLQRIVHRDVKPSNIMITDDNHIKLTDFGLARSMDVTGKISGSNEIWGTPLYLSPEYIRGDRVDHRSDIYSLGVMMYHTLAGDPPYTGRNPISIIHQHLEEPVPMIRHLRPDVPVFLERIIARAMAKDMDERYGSAEELIRDLKECASQIEQTNLKTTEPLALMPSKERAVTKGMGQLGKEIVPEAKIKVLVVDDSPTMCKGILRILREDPALDVVGTASHGEEALDLIQKLDPKVITLDYNMAVMDGSTTLKYIMSRCPRSVIMLSAFTYEGAWTSFDCLSYGAVDFIWKTGKSQRREFKQELVDKIKKASLVELSIQKKPRIAKSMGITGKNQAHADTAAEWLIVMGAGEGGYHTYLKILPYIPKNISCAVIVVHEMPDELTAAFCNYLEHYSKFTVKKVEERETLKEGVCYVTNHLSPVQINPTGEGFSLKRTHTTSEGSVYFQTYSSAAALFGHKAVAVVLTGYLPSVERGIRRVKDVGGTVLVQDPGTCLDPRTVKSLIQQKLADKVVLDVDMPSVLWHLLKKNQKKLP